MLDLLRSDYAIESDEADTSIAAALAARKSAIRVKAFVALSFATVGIAIAATYSAIQGFVGFAVIGLEPIAMALLALSSLAMGRALHLPRRYRRSAGSSLHQRPENRGQNVMEEG